MVAAPQYATMTVQDRMGNRIPIDLYISDVANAMVRFDAGQGASSTSPDFWSPGSAVLVRDIVIVTGLTDTTKMLATINNVGTGSIFRYATFDDGVNPRPPVNLVVRKGQQLRFIQLA